MPFSLSMQIILQVTMSAFRFLATGIICISTLVAMGTHPIVPEVSGPPYFAYTGLAEVKGERFKLSLMSVALFCSPSALLIIGAGFGLILTTSIFAQLIHYGVPGIIQPVRNKDKVRFLNARSRAALGPERNSSSSCCACSR